MREEVNEQSEKKGPRGIRRMGPRGVRRMGRKKV